MDIFCLFYPYLARVQGTEACVEVVPLPGMDIFRRFCPYLAEDVGARLPQADQTYRNCYPDYISWRRGGTACPDF